MNEEKMPQDSKAGRANIPSFQTNSPNGVNWLLAIAIDKYQHKPLNNCVRDVQTFIQVLTERYNLEEQHIIPLFDEEATADHIYEAFEDLFDKVKEHDNLIVYYSGHGDYHGRLKEGYWIPFDAESRAKYIANDTLKRYLREIRTRHTLIICDSCFSGTFAVKNSSDDYAPEALVQRYQDASRWVITSGSKQEVLDGAKGGHSPFADALLKKLRSHNGDLSARALGDYIISELAKKKIYQKPLSEAFDEEYHQGGLYVFFQRKNEAQLWATTQATDTADAYHAFWQQHPDSPHAEEALWRYACKQNDVAAYNDYLHQYRRGKYNTEAKKHLQELEDEATWKEALRKDTLSAYWDYLDRFEDEGGKYVAEAHQKIKAKTPPKETKTPPPKIIIPEEPAIILPEPSPLEGGGLEPEMVFVQGGTFQMGSNDYDNEKPVHEVALSDFYIGKYPVTFDEYDAFCDATKRKKNEDKDWGRGKRPVIYINWHDANAYAQWLSEQSGKHYRLPSEAEWEYAARGGNQSKGYQYVGSNNLDEVGWYNGNSNSKTHPVGEKKANELGIHDMSGNVWEWCADRYSSSYYQECYRKGVVENPTGAAKGTNRVLRGGSWGSSAQYCRATNRFNFTPEFRDYFIGFRLASSPQFSR
ncbi:MAG: SUMF1/EgtB/PvdO family nonheme iron enzyme [Saprospiraceae bacterium]|nr:SUMF1/EgtB/PvdO family nonheme iron enzyme [Saprospiraceae bacterium]